MSTRPTTRSQAAWAMALTSIAFFMGALDNLVVITALPAVHREIGGTLADLEWTVNAYTLAVAAGIITAAALGDRLGRRRVYTFGLVLFSLASAACALAPTAGVLIAARAVQGIGAAIITPLSLTILTAAFPASRRGAIVGVWGGIGGLAVAAGPLVGGAVTQGLSWHWIFWVNVPIGLVAAALSARLLAESHGPAARVDVPGLVLVSLGAVAVVLGLIRAGDLGWTSGDALIPLGAGLAALVAFIAWEQRAPEPMLPLRLLRIRPFAAAVITSFLVFGSIQAAAFLASQYFQLGLGYSPLLTGVRFLPWTGMAFVVAPLAGRLSDRVGTRPLMVIGLAVQAGALAWIAEVAATGIGYDRLAIPFMLGGIGISMALPTTPAAALGSVLPQDLGKASGIVNTMQRFGGAFSIAVVSAVFATNGALTSPAGVVAGFRPATAVVAGLSLLGAVAAMAVGSRRRAKSAGAGRVESLAVETEPAAVA
jgi:EmrB/QacA subfamily drug resistance transporter